MSSKALASRSAASIASRTRPSATLLASASSLAFRALFLLAASLSLALRSAASASLMALAARSVRLISKPSNCNALDTASLPDSACCASKVCCWASSAARFSSSPSSLMALPTFLSPASWANRSSSCCSCPNRAIRSLAALVAAVESARIRASCLSRSIVSCSAPICASADSRMICRLSWAAKRRATVPSPVAFSAAAMLDCSSATCA